MAELLVRTVKSKTSGLRPLTSDKVVNGILSSLKHESMGVFCTPPTTSYFVINAWVHLLQAERGRDRGGRGGTKGRRDKDRSGGTKEEGGRGRERGGGG